MDQTAGPSILRSPLSPTPGGNSQSPLGWVKKNKIPAVIILVVIIVIGLVAFGGTSLFSPSGSGFNLLAPRVNGLTEANLSLVPDRPSYRLGDRVIVDVKLFTGGYTTDSTDLVVKYDPAFLAPENDGFALAGDVYAEYPAIQIDKAQGLIGISGIKIPGGSSFNGAGLFATLYFKPLKDGQTKIAIEFQKDETADTNVVLTGSTKDILGSVSNADIIISGTDAQAPNLKDQSCKSFMQSCLDEAGNSGTQLCSGGSTKNGSCSYDSQFTQSCESCKVQ